MIKFLILAFLLTSFNGAEACSFDAEPFEEMIKDPSSAQTIMIVTVKVKGAHDRLVYSGNLWDSVSIPLSPICPIVATHGRKYILLSFLKINELKNSTQGLSDSNAWLVELAGADDLVTKLVGKSELPAGHSNVFWGYCQKDNECVPLKTSCGDTKSVNKKYQSNLEGYIKDSRNKCDRKKVTEKVSKCVENFCR